MKNISAESTNEPAGLLAYDGPTTNPVHLKNVRLTSTATILHDGRPTSLKLDLLGAGVRVKNILVVPASYYVAQLYSDTKDTFDRDPERALSSLERHATRVALKVNMVRTITGGEFASFFKDGLVANGHSLDDAEL